MGGRIKSSHAFADPLPAQAPGGRELVNRETMQSEQDALGAYALREVFHMMLTIHQRESS